MSRLVNLLLWQLRISNFEQTLISRTFNSFSEQLRVLISGQRLRFRFLILLPEQSSSIRLLISSSINPLRGQSSFVSFGQSLTNNLLIRHLESLTLTSLEQRLISKLEVGCDKVDSDKVSSDKVSSDKLISVS